MKTIPSSRRRPYLASVSIFLIVVVVVALIPGMAGCDGGGDGPYTLNITSTAGGYVYSPGEGIFDYDSGTSVNLVAVADEGYIFSHWGGDVSNIDNILDKETSISIFGNYRIRAVFFKLAPMVAAGYEHTVGLTSGSFPFACGTVVATNGYNYSSWTSIVQVAAGGDTILDGQTMGLKVGGTVVSNSLYDFSSWTDIVQVAVGGQHYVGLKSDGTVVARKTGPDLDYGECNVSGWTNIIQVAAGGVFTVGLESGGTVVATGYHCDVGEGNSAVSGWTDIMQVAAGGAKGFAIGLTNTGTVVNTGGYDCSSWTDIIQISAGTDYVVGLTNTGTVVAVGNNYSGQCDVTDWMNIIQVSAGAGYSQAHGHTVGLMSDGTVVAVGSNSSGELDVVGWDLMP